MYLIFSNKPKETNPNLFNLTKNKQATGILTDYYPHLINWILATPPSNLQILSRGGEHVTSLINPESLILTNPIKAWIFERIIQDKNSSVRIGNNALDSDTLFGYFNSWALMFNGEVGIIKSNQFSPLLIGNLQAMNWDFEKRRNAAGFIIKGG